MTPANVIAFLAYLANPQNKNQDLWNIVYG